MILYTLSAMSQSWMIWYHGSRLCSRWYCGFDWWLSNWLLHWRAGRLHVSNNMGFSIYLLGSGWFCWWAITMHQSWWCSCEASVGSSFGEVEKLQQNRFWLVLILARKQKSLVIWFLGLSDFFERYTTKRWRIEDATSIFIFRSIIPIIIPELLIRLTYR